MSAVKMTNFVGFCGIKEMEQALRQGKKCQVVDVREWAEIRAAAVEGTIPMPLSSFDGKSAKRLDKDLPVYLLCRTGSRARDAAICLKNLGFKRVYVVEGGIKEWVEAGKPVVRVPARTLFEKRAGILSSLLAVSAVLVLFVNPHFLWATALLAVWLLYLESLGPDAGSARLARIPAGRGSL